MFVFEDIVGLPNVSIQRVMREITDTREIAIALKTASQAVRDAILSGVSKRMGATIIEEMDYLGPLRRSDVEEAQQKFVTEIRRLQELGEIVVARAGSDDLIL
jgi:flagellar motor switch protein FliG